MEQPEYIKDPEAQNPKADIVQRGELMPRSEGAGICKAGHPDTDGQDLSRRRILDDLARAEYEEGVYDQVPDDFSP
jgi:hypothetical protein